MNIILASASPRRKALLGVLGLDFEISISTCEEIIDENLPVFEIVKSLSLQKAIDVAKKSDDDSLIIGADTVVAFDGKILGKPKNKQDAFLMLKMLSGQTHDVYTGFTIIRNGDNKIITDYEVSHVTFKNISETEIKNYIETNEPMDKAGAYSIQGIASSFVENLKGDYNNVVGLPIYKLSKYLYNTFDINRT